MRHIKIVLVIILLISAILRITLAWYNPFYDDPHILDISRMLGDSISNNELSLCNASCYMPKFYYLVNVFLLRALNIEQPNWLITTNLINSFLSIVMIIYVLAFLIRINPKDYVKIIAFSLVAFNPGLIRVNIQTIPDTFVISFGVICSYYAFFYFREKKLKDLFLMTFFCILASISKMNGIILLFSILIFLLIDLLVNYKFRFIIDFSHIFKRQKKLQGFQHYITSYKLVINFFAF